MYRFLNAGPHFREHNSYSTSSQQAFITFISSVKQQSELDSVESSRFIEATHLGSIVSVLTN